MHVQPVLLALWLGAGLCLSQAQARPFTPRSDDEVVETLRDRPLSDEERDWRNLRAQARQQPGDAILAARVARRAIELSRQDGDPRWMGQAQGALGPWWSQAKPPTDIQLLRATILQNQHEFGPALKDLDAVVQRAPDNAQAWLTRATVLQVQGRYAEARRSCENLSQLNGADWHGRACLVELSSLQGQAEPAMAQLELLRRRAPSPLQPWLTLMQAELSERLGLRDQADALYRQLLISTPDAYTEGAYADLLLDQGRASEVIPRLDKQQRNDGLLLRLALAYAQTRDARLDATVQALRARFAAAHERGDSVHRREEARFTLHLLKRPAAALQLAQANWAVQKEPADARIFLEAAQAAGRPEAAKPVLDFARASGWTDQRLSPWL